MPDVITGNTQLAATKADLIATVAQRELAFAAKLMPTITDVSQFAIPGHKSIRFPKLTSFVVEERASAVAGEIQTLTSSVDTLNLNIPAYISWLVDQNDAIQTRIDFQLEASARAAAAHGRLVDSKIIAELQTVAGLDIDVPLTAAKILQAREFLVKNDANMADVVFVVSPNLERVMLGLDEFSKADIFGGGAPIFSGVIGKVYGVPVIVHNGLADNNALMYEKTGCAIGFQKAPAYGEQPELAYGVGAMRAAMDALYGVKGLQLGLKGLGATLSPLVAKFTPA